MPHMQQSTFFFFNDSRKEISREGTEGERLFLVVFSVSRPVINLVRRVPFFPNLMYILIKAR